MLIEELNLSHRVYNCLKRSKIETVEQLSMMSDYDLMRIRSFGQTCLAEVRAKVALPTKTNADRIRAMSDEELAKFIVGNAEGEEYQTYEYEFSIENVRYFGVDYEHQGKTAEDSVLYWLRQSAEVTNG